MIKNCKAYIMRIMVLLCFLAIGLTFFGQPLFAIQQKSATKLSFTKSKDVLKSSISLPVEVGSHTISISPGQLKKRILLSEQKDSVQPVELLVKDGNLQQLKEDSKKFALPGKQNMLFAILKKKLKGAPFVSKGSSTKKIVVGKAMLKYLNMEALQEYFQDKHMYVIVKSDETDSETFDQIATQMQSYLGKEGIDRIRDKYEKKEILVTDHDLLPSFAAKMSGKYTIYKGPNCFHAALAFQDSIMPRLPSINIKVESGYHRAMINYDELWNVLQNGFYEVNPERDSLKYGDVLVFFETKDSSRRSTVDFHWIRHAATYLFNDFTFSKGSKSPNTPYTIKNIEAEWSTWEKYTKQLGLKVFRRKSLDHVLPPRSLTDWIY